MEFVGLVLFGAIVGYSATVHADYLIHRNVWHGRWRIVHSGPLRWLLRPHYVHRWKAHHRHARHHRDRLESGGRVPETSFGRVEERFQDSWHIRYGLRCTEHGITIRGVECLAHYWAVFFVTPQPYVAAAVWLSLGPAAGVPATLMPVCAVITQVMHRYYHMTPSTRATSAPRSIRWAVRSREFARLAEAHQRHHYDPRYKDDCYGVLPFGNRLLRPLYGKN